MESLYRHCLSAVANVIESNLSNSEYEDTCYTDLPRGVSKDLMFYLSPRKLFLSQDVILKHNINTERVWHIHFKKRWSYKHQIVPKIFKHNNEAKKQTSMSQYIEKHFHDAFRALSFPMSSQEAHLNKGLLCMITSVQEHVINKLKTKISEEHKEELTDILKLLPYVSNLSVLGNQSKMLFKEKYILHFRKNVTRIDLHVLKKSSIEDSTNLILDLLHNGTLKELNLFHPRLAMRIFERLIHACAGHIKPSVVPVAQPEPEEPSLEIGDWNESAAAKSSQANGTNETASNTIDNWNRKDIATNTFPVDMLMDLVKNPDHANILLEYQQNMEDDDWLDEEEDWSTDGDSGDELFDNALEGLDDDHPEHDFDMQGLSWYKSKEIYSCVTPWDFERDEDETEDIKCDCNGKLSDDDLKKGLKAFSVVGIERVESDFYNEAPRLADILSGVLPLWHNLQCLALAGCEIKDLFLTGKVANLTTNAQLKEVIIENMNFTDGSILEFVSDIILQEGREKPMERLMLMNIPRGIWATKEEVEDLPKEIHGFVEFELRGGNLIEKGFQFITAIVSRDQALRHLSLCGLDTHKKKMIKILQASRTTGLLESLDLSESYFDEDVEKELCKTIKSLPNLKSLSLKSTLISKDFLMSDDFIELLNGHKSLVEIDLSDNRLGNAIPVFLCKLLGEKSTRLESINVSYTLTTGEMLLSAAKDILGLSSGNRSSASLSHYRLKSLDISGNKLGKLAKEVVMKWGLISQDVECKCDDFTVPFAEYVSQM